MGIDLCFVNSLLIILMERVNGKTTQTLRNLSVILLAVTVTSIVTRLYYAYSATRSLLDTDGAVVTVSCYGSISQSSLMPFNEVFIVPMLLTLQLISSLVTIISIDRFNAQFLTLATYLSTGLSVIYMSLMVYYIFTYISMHRLLSDFELQLDVQEVDILYCQRFSLACHLVLTTAMFWFFAAKSFYSWKCTRQAVFVHSRRYSSAGNHYRDSG